MVSIPFIAGQWSLRGSGAGAGPREKVSIPFIAGQWSLRRCGGRRSPTCSCFNPLHCGAVVASFIVVAFVISQCSVSIPFIAGQWSLLYYEQWVFINSCFGFNPLHCGAVVASGRTPPRVEELRGGFNPLHCGAVVASDPGGEEPDGGEDVSIPFIAGQWSLRSVCCVLHQSCCQVSIPFIAGQWSLRKEAQGVPTTSTSFNPLHCGAVVASLPPLPSWLPEIPVSIPFIAGQWSLHLPCLARVLELCLFQSPSLRGSGRFSLYGLLSLWL